MVKCFKRYKQVLKSFNTKEEKKNKWREDIKILIWADFFPCASIVPNTQLHHNA
jgi:hypothetical protein